MTAKEAARRLILMLGAPKSQVTVWEWFDASEPTLLVRLAPVAWHLRGRLPERIGNFIVQVELRDEALISN